MPLEKEYSIVADSTGSSPPPPTVDTPLETRRVIRTYGRRREEPPVEDAAPSSSYVEHHSLTRNSVHNTAPPGLADEVPPSSPRANVADTGGGRRVEDEDEDDESITTGESMFNFGWRDKLRAMDEDDNQEAEMSVIPRFDDAPGQSTFGQPLLLQGTTSTLLSPNTPTKRDTPSMSTSVVDNVFGPDPFSARATTPRGVTPGPSFSLSSPSIPRPLISRGRIRKAVIRDSDSEQELPKDSSSTTASGSSKQKSRSSSTQPTSDDEMPLQILPKSQSAYKRKATQALRSSVPQLQFTEDPASEIKKSSVASKKKKAKAPTNKEKEEMVKERGRLAAQVAVSIPRIEATSKYSKDYLFAKISGKHNSNQQTSTSKATLPTSDPIGSFSSPTKDRPASPEVDNSLLHSPQRRNAAAIHRSPSPHHDSSGDSDLPDISEALTSSTRENIKKKELMEMKRRALEHRKHTAVDDDDDDLEIVQSNAKVAVKEEETHRRTLHKRPSEGRKRQMQLAQINPTKQAANIESPVRKNEHGEGSLSIFQQGGPLDSKKLNQILAAEVQKNALFEMKKKAAEWQKYGGRTGGNPEGHAKGLTSVVQTLAERGLKAAEILSTGEVDMNMDEDEDENDDDWDPALRGSASPEPGEENEEEDEGEDDQEADENNRNLNADTNAVDDFQPPDDEGSNIRPIRRMVIASDSEEEDNKENDTDLMYDHSEDKENTAVVRHEPLTLAPRSLFSGGVVSSPPLSPSTQPRLWGARSRAIDLDDDHTPNQRRPFKELISEESPRSTQILHSNLTQSFTAKLQQASPLPSTFASAPKLKPFFSAEESSSGGFGGFSQFSQTGGDVFVPAPSLQPGFSDLFESATEKQKSTTGTSEENLSNKKHVRKVNRIDTLDLTQDFNAANQLQPAFQASDNLLRKADAIFEEEQEFVVEGAKRKEQKKPELYVNDHGFLTQTRPAEGTPEIYRPSSTQDLHSSRRVPSLSSQQSSRAPLRTLSMTSSYPESPTQPSPRRRRLQRLAHTPPPLTNDDDSPKPPQRKLNAFDMLASEAQKLKKRDERKSRPDLSAYLENEAAESDEDAFGFAKPKNAEDDEDGEDLDATLEELMDDKELDQSAIAPDLVHAKFMEQLEVEDQENEKFHQGVIQGEQRLKRRRGVEIDDSDEDSDMEDNEKARRAMKKLRKSDRGDIKTLEENEATRAFAESYNQTLKDDDTEFLYLEQETTFEDISKDKMEMDDNQDFEDDEEEENEEPETISHDEIIRQIRQNKEEGIEDTGVDFQDVSWVDQEEEEAPRVKTVNSRIRPKARFQVTLEQSEMDGMGAAFRKPANPSTSSSSKLWYAQEHKSRNAGTSRSVGGSAITGHAKAKSKAGNGTVRAGSMAKRSAAASSSTSTGSRTVKAAPSMLSVISDKSRHFA